MRIDTSKMDKPLWGLRIQMDTPCEREGSKVVRQFGVYSIVW